MIAWSLSANLEPSRLSGKLSSQARYSSCRAISAATAAAQRLGRGGRRGADAAHGRPVCWRSLARRRACRSAAVSGASWMRCLGMLISVVKRDCHVSLWPERWSGLSFDDKRLLASVRGEFAIKARTSRHKLVSGELCCELNHDAVIRIGGEAPGRRAHSKPRHRGHVQYRVAATSDRHLQSVIKYASVVFHAKLYNVNCTG